MTETFGLIDAGTGHPRVEPVKDALDRLRDASNYWLFIGTGQGESTEALRNYQELYTRASEYRDYIVQQEAEFWPSVRADLLVASAGLDSLSAAYYQGLLHGGRAWQREAARRLREVEEATARLEAWVAEHEGERTLTTAGERQLDVVVVGSGVAAMWLARALRDSGVPVRVLDEDTGREETIAEPGRHASAAAKLHLLVNGPPFGTGPTHRLVTREDGSVDAVPVVPRQPGERSAGAGAIPMDDAMHITIDTTENLPRLVESLTSYLLSKGTGAEEQR